MPTDLLRFDRTVERDPAIEAWFEQRPGELGAIARQWFNVTRSCGDEVRELLQDVSVGEIFRTPPFSGVLQLVLGQSPQLTL